MLGIGCRGLDALCGGVDDHHQTIDIRDPMLDTLKATVAASQEGEARVQALLGIKAVFGDELPKQSAFVQAVTKAYLALVENGAANTCASLVK